MARLYIQTFADQTRPRQQDVVQFLRKNRNFRWACSKYGHEISVQHWLTGPEPQQPVLAASQWALPIIESAQELADWLWLDIAELQWFADLKGLTSKNSGPSLNHYRYTFVPKRSGSLRLIEAPKARLKQSQRKILSSILNRIPSHPTVHGFVKGRSIQTFAASHVGQRVVLRMDLQDFFPSFRAARVQAFFRTAGYPESVADLLTGICTHAAPREIWKGLPAPPGEMRALYSRPHLPQGAPTSPALANLLTYRADCRLHGLAQASGAVYTRYADDLAFSGGERLHRGIERFSLHAAAILLEEGFAIQHRKTRIMRQGVRQHMAGLVTNQRVNIVRADFDGLKAILTNCVRSGPESQNRDAHPNFQMHLAGRVGFVESIHPAKGKRLRAILEQIQWEHR